MKNIFAQVCASSGLPPPVAEYRFCSERRWRMDYAWPDYMIALEVDGGVWIRGRHSRGSGMIGDMEKYNHAACDGWRVLRVTPSTLLATDTFAMLARVLTGAAPQKSNQYSSPKP